MSDETNDTDETTDAALGVPAWMILFVIAATPVVYATGFSQFEVVKELILAVGAGVALLAWGTTLVVRGRIAVVAGRVVSLLAAFGLFALASVFWSEGFLYGAVHGSQIFALVAAVIVLSAPTERPVRFFDFAVAVSAGLGITGLFGIMDFAGIGIFTPVWDPPGPAGAFDAMEFAVAYYAVALPVALAGVQYADDGYRYFFGGASLLGAIHFALITNWLFIGIFLGVCLAAALLILAYEGVETVEVLSPLAAMVGFVVLAAFLAAQFAPTPSEPNDATSLPQVKRGLGVTDQVLKDRRIRNPAFAIGRMETVRTNEERAYLAQVSFDLIQERPFVGRGPGAWWRLQTKHPNIDHPAVSRRFTHYPAYKSPHNNWSKLLVEYGIIGFALFLLWLAGCAAIGLGALGRSGEHASLIDEQWGLWALALAGVAFGTVTPLIELAPAAIVWIAGIAVLTRRSAVVNEYTGASMRWTIGGGEGGRSLPGGLGAVAAAIAIGMATIATVDSISRLYRGWGDQLMLRTYYERAIDQYETADAWMPIRGGVVYNRLLAQSRLGTLNEEINKALEEKLGGQRGGPTAEPPERAKARGPDGERGDEKAPDAGAEGDEQAEESSPPSRREIILQTDAHQRVERAADLRPYDARVLDLASQFYVRWQFPEEALQTARRAVKSFPNGVSMRKTLATSLRLRGEFDDAAEQLLALLERSPPDRETYILHYQLGRLYFEYLDQFVEAKEHLEKALEKADSQQSKKRVEQQIEKIEERLKRQRRKREGKPPEEIEDKVPESAPKEFLKQQRDAADEEENDGDETDGGESDGGE